MVTHARCTAAQSAALQLIAELEKLAPLALHKWQIDASIYEAKLIVDRLHDISTDLDIKGIQ